MENTVMEMKDYSLVMKVLFRAADISSAASGR